MVYIIDIIIILLIALSVYLGYKRGFVKTVFSCFSLVIALFSASVFGPYIGAFIKTTPVYGTMAGSIKAEISEYFDDALENGQELSHTKDGDESSALASSLFRFGFDMQQVKEGYENALESGAENAKEQISEKMTDKALSCFANALGMLIAFILSLILLRVISSLLSQVVKLPLLSTLNRLSGLVAGFVFGVFGVFVLCMAVEILLPFIPKNPVIYMGIDKQTTLYGMFLDLNPVILLLFA